MRQKNNEDKRTIRPVSGQSDYYRYFKYYYDHFLPPRPDVANLEELARLYVKNQQVETLLMPMLDAGQSYVQLLVGHTGSGKSTIIRNFFNLWHVNKLVRENHVLLPFFFNPMPAKPEPSKVFAAQLRVVTDELQKISQEPLNLKGLWEFINAQKPEVLRRHRGFQFESEKKDLELLFGADEFAYCSMLFKYLMSHKNCSKLKHAIIIVDDIESLPKDFRRKIIEYSYHAFQCLCNKDSDMHVKMLLTSRPHTRREFHCHNWQEQHFDLAILECASLKDIFQARHQYSLAKSPAENRKNWSETFQILSNLIGKIDHHGREFLLNLANYNIRHAMLSVDSILSQGTWFQTNDAGQPSFTIDHNTIRIKVTNGRILKALSYGSRNLYADGNSGEYGVSNILKNWDDPESDLASPYLMKWLTNKLDFSDLSAAGNVRDFQDLLDRLQHLLPLNKSFAGWMDRSYRYFVEQEIVDDAPGLHEPSKAACCIMPRGVILWEELRSSNELLSIYRDDLWFDLQEIDLSDESTSDSDHVFRCINMCRLYLQKEIDLHKNLNSLESRRQFRSIFGEELFSLHLADGIIQSIRRIYGDNRPARVDREYAALFSDIKKQKEVLGG